MKRRIETFGLAVILLVLSGSNVSYAQQHNHPQQANATKAPLPASSQSEEIAIFCPTMKTGQLCSSGTANILQLKDEQRDQWIELARKYNKAVDAATLQLFKESEGVLSKEQVELLKAWFAVGLNPQMNDLLFGKGLGPQKR